MPNCPRCSATLKPTEPKTAGISFYECPDCASQYARQSGEDLHDRWLMPLSLPLYVVIFDRDPASRAIDVARQFCDRDELELDILEQHIAEELGNPKQKVSEIHDFAYADEHQLREFLGSFLEALKELRRA